MPTPQSSSTLASQPPIELESLESALSTRKFAEMASPSEELPLSNDASSPMASMAENAQRRFMDSINSAPSLHYNSFKDFARDAVSQYKGYEDAFFLKFKEGFMSARDNPLPAVGVAIAAGLILMRGPRRILFRHTLGRLQNEEAQFIRAEKNVKELSLSVDLMKKESKKLLERTALAEKDMKYGHKELSKAGGQIQHLANTVYKVEAQAADLMDGLRDVPGREALRLRAEVASIASLVKQQRAALGKRIMRISEFGVPV